MENQLRLSAELSFPELRSAQKKIVHLVEFRGYDTINIDFSDTEICFADVMLPLVMFVSKYREQGVTFSLTMPKNTKLSKLFSNTNWAHYISPKNFARRDREIGGNLPVRFFRDLDEQTQVVNEIVKNTLLTLSWLERSHLRALEWSLNEIIDNALTHSESDVGGAVQVSVHPNTRDIEFVVSDAGIGIPNSLRTAFPHIESDVIALDHAIKEGVTRGTGQGNGLFGSSQISAISGGRFHINSGEAFLLISKNGVSRRERQLPAICGSTVLCTINAATPLLLESALKISGRPFNPADTLEIEYDTDETTVPFNLSTEARSFGSRMEGSRIRQRIETLLRSFPERKIIVDANGAGVFSSSFADELFAKLLISLEQSHEESRLITRNIAPINQMLISRSIEQRRREIAAKSSSD